MGGFLQGAINVSQKGSVLSNRILDGFKKKKKKKSQFTLCYFESSKIDFSLLVVSLYVGQNK